MSHGSETRRMRGGKTGAKGRRSREGAGLGSSLRMTEDEGTLKSFRIKDAYNRVGREIIHDWFGDSKKPESERSKLIKETEKKGILRTDYTSLINRKG